MAEDTTCVSLGQGTGDQTTPYGSGVKWGGENIYQGGLSCLDKADLQTLFVESYGYWNKSDVDFNFSDAPTADNDENYVHDNDAGGLWDKSGGQGTTEADLKIIIPPTISAVIATTKFDNNGKTIYAAVPNKITVSTPDVEQTSGDIIYHGGQLQVGVKFYAWASDDQMPLRSIIVKWGDDSLPISSGEGSKFQNHKPRCQHDANEKLGICNEEGAGKLFEGYACAEDADCAHLKVSDTEKCKLSGAYKDDRFGDTEQACLEGYFQYNHTYSCNAPTQMDVPGEGSVKACKFQIGVQAKDNWGWCNTNDLKGAYGDGAKDYCNLADINNTDAAEKYDGAIYMIP